MEFESEKLFETAANTNERPTWSKAVKIAKQYGPLYTKNQFKYKVLDTGMIELRSDPDNDQPETNEDDIRKFVQFLRTCFLDQNLPYEPALALDGADWVIQLLPFPKTE